MQDSDFETAKTVKAQIAAINHVQAKIAVSGAKALAHIATSDNKESIGFAELKTALGDSAYNTICATALTSISSGLASRKTTLQSQFDDLGS